MFKKLTSLFISVLLIVSCMAVPVMAEGTAIADGVVLTYADVVDSSNSATLTFTVAAAGAGNYSIEFNGGVQHDYHMDMTYHMEFTDGKGAKQELIATAPWTGNSTDNAGYAAKKTSDAGVVTLTEGNYTLKFSHLGGGTTKDFKLTFNCIGEANPEDTYTIVKSFGQVSSGVYYDTAKTNIRTEENYLQWDNVEVNHPGDYDVYYYGGVEHSTAFTNTAVNVETTNNGNTTETGISNLPWTGTGGTKQGSVFGEESTYNGRTTRILTKVGTLRNLQSGDHTLKFKGALSTAKGVLYAIDGAKLYMVRRCKDNYEKTLKKNDGTAEGLNSDNAFAAGSTVTWQNIYIDHAGEYEIKYTGGAQNNTAITSMSLKFDIWNQSIKGTAEGTGTNKKNLYEVSASNAGWGTVLTSTIGKAMLDGGTTYSAVLTNLGGATSRDFYDITLTRVGEYVEPTQLAVSDVSVVDNKVVIDFNKDLVQDDANLSKITVTAVNGTASLDFYTDTDTGTVDASKVIVTGVSGKIDISIDAELVDTEGVILYNDYTADCHITSCTIDKMEIKTYDGSYHGFINVGEVLIDNKTAKIQLYIALYDEKDNLIAVSETAAGAKSVADGAEGVNVSLGVDSVATYEGKFHKAKLFVWEQGLLTPLAPSIEKLASDFATAE